MKIKHQNCSGCSVNNSPIEDCNYYNYNKDGSCPCTECLVKTMCKSETQECDPFYTWSGVVTGAKLEYETSRT